MHVAHDLSDLRRTYESLERNTTRVQRIFEQGNARLRELMGWEATECYLCGIFGRYDSLLTPEARELMNASTCAPIQLCREGELPPTDAEMQTLRVVATCPSCVKSNASADRRVLMSQSGSDREYQQLKKERERCLPAHASRETHGDADRLQTVQTARGPGPQFPT